MIKKTAAMVVELLKHQVKDIIYLFGSEEKCVNTLRVLRTRASEDGALYVVPQARRSKVMHELARVGKLPAPQLKEVVFPYAAENCALVFVPSMEDLDLLEATSDAMARLTAWDANLQRLLAEDAEISAFSQVGQEIMPYEFALLSRELLVITCTAGFPQEESDAASEEGYQLPPSRVGALVNSAAYQESLTRQEPYYMQLEEGGLPLFACNMFLNGAYLSRLVVRVPAGQSSLSRGAEQLVVHFAAALEQAYKRFSGNVITTQTLNDAVHTFARALIGGQEQPSPEALAQALSLYGWRDEDRYTVIKLDFFEHTKWDTASLYLVHLLASKWHDTMVLIQDRSLVWIVNESKKGPTETARHRIGSQDLVSLVKDHACQAGISLSFQGFHKLNAYLRQADMALRIGRLRAPHFWYHLFEEYELPYMLDQVTADFTAEQLCHSGVALLREYDAANDTDYAETLRRYLQCFKNVTHAAQELHIHRTSLMRRLERIQAISGIDWDDPDEVLHVLLSYRLLREEV